MGDRGGSGLQTVRTAAIESGFAGSVEIIDDMDELRARMAAVLNFGDLVLLKGSRGSALERLEHTLSEIRPG
jgi:UDP-N-acetylmuramyl pentapeptide synthase